LAYKDIIMATLTLRLVKGEPLTNSEVDGNFVALNNEKADKHSPTFTGAALGESFNGITGLSQSLPLAETSEGSPGTSQTAARGDHSHPVAGGFLSSLPLEAGEYIEAGQVCYINSEGRALKASAAATGLIVIAMQTIYQGAIGSCSFIGPFSKPSHGFTLGQPLYLSDTAGLLSNTPSSAFVRIVGYAVSTDTIYLIPDATWIEL